MVFKLYFTKESNDIYLTIKCGEQTKKINNNPMLLEKSIEICNTITVKGKFNDNSVGFLSVMLKYSIKKFKKP